MIEHHFGEGVPLALGVEEELMIVDAETLDLAPRIELFTAREGLKSELFAAIVETTTPPCATLAEAVESMLAGRCAAAEIAAANGLAIAAAGSHPFAIPEEQEITPEQRYLGFAGRAGVSARRQGVQGLHVHVAIPGPEECWRALETVLPWLPVVLALSANSPWLAGVATGLASNRAEVLAQLPRSGAPPAFRSYAEWEGWVERLARLGIAEDASRYWWDVRPGPRFGTLELRVPDQPTEPARAAGLVALLHGLAAAALELPEREYDPPGRGVYAQNRWSALRYGPAAQLVHPDGDRVVPVAELAEELFALAGARIPLDCEGDRQLAAGSPEAAAAELVRLTSA